MVQKKEKDRGLRMFKILVFFGRPIAWPRWHASKIYSRSNVVLSILQRFP
jgi:hypothetical protein